ncbi:hypothetical protein GCM10020220_064780 [Nonomuraea rubra]
MIPYGDDPHVSTVTVKWPTRESVRVDLVPQPLTDRQQAIDVPGLLAEYLEATASTGPAELRAAQREGWVIRRGAPWS